MNDAEFMEIMEEVDEFERPALLIPGGKMFLLGWRTPARVLMESYKIKHEKSDEGQEMAAHVLKRVVLTNEVHLNGPTFREFKLFVLKSGVVDFNIKNVVEFSNMADFMKLFNEIIEEAKDNNRNLNDMARYENWDALNILQLLEDVSVDQFLLLCRYGLLTGFQKGKLVHEYLVWRLLEVLKLRAFWGRGIVFMLKCRKTFGFKDDFYNDTIDAVVDDSDSDDSSDSVESDSSYSFDEDDLIYAEMLRNEDYMWTINRLPELFPYFMRCTMATTNNRKLKRVFKRCAKLAVKGFGYENREIEEKCKKFIEQPCSLKHICRCNIRYLLNQKWNLPFGIYELDLPEELHKYLDLLEE